MSVRARRWLPFSSRQNRSPVRRKTRRLMLESAEARCLMAADGFELLPDASDDSGVSAEVSVVADQDSTARSADGPSPVLMVISNQDFWYQDYADTRATLEAAGLEVVVAATTTDVARPHANSGQGADGGFVTPDLALTDVEAEDYSGIVFSGGWGMAQYQYGYEGTYHNSALSLGNVIVVSEGETTRSESQPKPVLMVIANQDFYHREYYETRESLEAAGLEVVIATTTTDTATPHAVSVIEGREPNVEPDLALSDAKSEDDSAIVFVGGYGAASYQYAYEGTYDNPAAKDQAIVDLVK